MDDGTVEGGFANANCDAFDAGAVSIDAYAWSSAPRDAMLRVGVEARADRGARETYASVLIANDVDREVNLNGVTIQYEFYRLVREDGNATTFTTTPVSAGDFELACWGAQIVGPDGARRTVDCADLNFEMNDSGPRVVFGPNIALNAGEFLAGGYSNFLFSFRDSQNRVMDVESVRALDPTCDATLFDAAGSRGVDIAPTSTFGWNPNENLMLSVCPSLLDGVFDTLSADGNVVRGVVGHRGCGALDVSKLAFAIDLGGAYDEESIQVTCEGLQIVHPISSIPSGDDRVGCKIDVNDRGVELRFDRDDVVLCPGCFLVGGQNNVVVSFSYDDDRDFSDTTISEARAF